MIRIAVYDILLPLTPAHANPILVPQPPPHLPTLFPPSAGEDTPGVDLQAKAPSTYIGTMPFALTLPPARSGEDDKASSPAHSHGTPPKSPRRRPLLYALSSSSYPLINFAPPPRPGILANGSFLLSDEVPEDYQLMPYLLDPPVEDMTPAPTGEKGMIEVTARPVSKGAKKNWLWWMFGALSGITLCGLALAGVWHRRDAIKASASSADEKTPLLVIRSDEPRTEVVEQKPIINVDSTVTTPAQNLALTGDEDMTPKKKPARRRVRGRKKRRDSNAALLEKDGDGEDDDEDDKGDSSSSPPLTVSRKDEKPLPELPREMTSTALGDMEDKERLAISDTIIGKRSIFFGING